MYFVRVTYNEDTPDDLSEYETASEAAEAYADAIAARADLGPSGFGDCARIYWGHAGKRSIKGSTSYT